jgi:hypothetical protein
VLQCHFVGGCCLLPPGLFKRPRVRVMEEEQERRTQLAAKGVQSTAATQTTLK